MHLPGTCRRQCATPGVRHPTSSGYWPPHREADTAHRERTAYPHKITAVPKPLAVPRNARRTTHNQRGSGQERRAAALRRRTTMDVPDTAARASPPAMQHDATVLAWPCGAVEA